jgi:hypothetical protein
MEAIMEANGGYIVIFACHSRNVNRLAASLAIKGTKTTPAAPVENTIHKGAIK